MQTSPWGPCAQCHVFSVTCFGWSGSCVSSGKWDGHPSAQHCSSLSHFSITSVVFLCSLGEGIALALPSVEACVTANCCRLNAKRCWVGNHQLLSVTGHCVARLCQSTIAACVIFLGEV